MRGEVGGELVDRRVVVQEGGWHTYLKAEFELLDQLYGAERVKAGLEQRLVVVKGLGSQRRHVSRDDLCDRFHDRLRRQGR